MEKIANIHPGEILNEEFLVPLGISAYKLSKSIGVQQTRISLILKGERGITADTAMRLAKYFGTSPEFWMNLQIEYDLRKAKTEIKEILDNIVPITT
jgi:addiction module HigA family antidote